MRTPVAVCLTALAALLSLAGPAAAQGRMDARAYRALLDEVGGGLFITSGRALAAYAPDSVGPVVEDFLASRPSTLELKTAALLHTEAAPLARRGAERHVQWARALLDAIPEPAEREAWLRRWWLAIGSSYQVSLNSVAGMAAFESALEDLPGDREIRVAFARMAQMVGRQREEHPYILRAGELLEELLADTPDDAELRVRFAGVLLDLGRPEDAALVLDQLGDARLRSGPRLASLLLRGEIALGAGEYAAAEAAFAEAVRRSRRSPAAVSGLVAARLAQGNAAGASEAAAALLGRRPTGWEPEWRYWLGPALEFQEMFQAMKDEVRQAVSEGGS